MNSPLELRTVQVTRYIAPLREGGSLPAIAEADDDFKYVLKFRGSGHGVKSLISELIGGEIARLMQFKVPELVFCMLDEAFGRTEADEEIQDLLRESQGLNLGLHFLSGAINFDPVVTQPAALLASKVVLLDAFLTNIDRTAKNTNMLIWNRELWLIDHGASLFFQHSWDNWEQHARSPFTYVKDHVLLPFASELEAAHQELITLLTPERLKAVTDLIPVDWLQWEENDLSADEIRSVYYQFLTIRLEHSKVFLKEAQDARGRL